MCDPIGRAIYDYFENGTAPDISIETTYTKDELLSPAYFFRTTRQMPSIERTALTLSAGRILDVGAAAGCHSLPLQEKGLDVTALDNSIHAVEVMKKRGVYKTVCADIHQFHEKEFDTILLLMNGTGIGGTLNGLKNLLLHLKSLLATNGRILIDSSDITYLFQEADGSLWIDLANDNYPGEMIYTLNYKDYTSSFQWLFADFNTLRTTSRSAGLKCKLIEEGPHFDYLAQLSF